MRQGLEERYCLCQGPPAALWRRPTAADEPGSDWQRSVRRYGRGTLSLSGRMAAARAGKPIYHHRLGIRDLPHRADGVPFPKSARSVDEMDTQHSLLVSREHKLQLNTTQPLRQRGESLTCRA